MERNDNLFADGSDKVYTYSTADDYHDYADLDKSKSKKTFKSQFYSPFDLQSQEISDLKKLPLFMKDGTFGIDGLTISIGLDEDSIDLAEFLANLIGRGNKTKGAVSLPNMPSAWIFWPSTDTRQRLKISFNPSNFSRLDGFEICPPPLLNYYVEKALRAILRKGDKTARPSFMSHEPYGMLEPWPENWTSEVELFQVHYARDLLIKDPDFDLSIMHDLKPKYAKATLVYRNSGVVETISHPGSKKIAKHSFYDKHRERERLLRSKKKYKNAFARIQPGTKRYEVQVPRAELKKYNNLTLDILTPDRILKAAVHYWELSNYGQKINLWEADASIH